MHYVYLTNDKVSDQIQIDPYKVFNTGYASGFIEAPDEVTFNWKFEDGQWIAPLAPPEPTPEQIKTQNKHQASILLQKTDWVELGDVADPANPPYLSNKSAFTTYRAALRSIAVNPPLTPAEFPVKPDEVWSQ